MTHLHWECRAGAAGDMLLASLLAAGADAGVLRRLLADVGLGDVDVRVTSVMRAGISSLHVQVGEEDRAVGDSRAHSHGVPGDTVAPSSHPHAHGHSHSHDHTHPHAGDHAHGSAHPHSHRHPEDGAADHSQGKAGEGPSPLPQERMDAPSPSHAQEVGHRHLRDMLALADRFDVPESVREHARRVFRLLAEAEASIHGLPVEEVHFHEISGIDTAVDVLGVCWAFHALGIDSCTATPVSVGGGTVGCAHGVLSVPAPATLEIFRRAGIPIESGPVERELCTPTGAALLAVLVDRFAGPEPGRVCGIGYGAGTMDFAGVPNVVRAVLYEPLAAGEGCTGGGSEWVWELVTVVDDATAEEVAYALERCLEAGALDGYTVPAAMKKGRMGMEVTVLSVEAEVGRMTDLLFRHTGTLGVRRRRVERRVLSRDERVVTVEGHPVRVKRVIQGGRVLRVKAEYDDCRGVAEATGVSFTLIRRRAERAACPCEGGGEGHPECLKRPPTGRQGEK